ncbi:MAG: PKD domain-containing protein, partial [Bacteroidota bacterium]
IIAAIPSQTSFCNGLTVSLNNESINSSFWQWDFGVPFEIYDTSNTENPSFTYPGPGTYTITLVANPGWSCADTATTNYTVYPDIDPIITLGDYACVNNQDEWEFWGNATLTNGGTYSWDFGSGAIPNSADVVHPQNVILNSANSSNTITLTVTADNGCSESTTLVVNNPPDPVANIPPQNTFCDGLTYTFPNVSVNASDYWWEFNTVFNGDYSDDQFPSFTFPDTGQYTIQLIASALNTCPDTTEATIFIFGNLQPSFPALEEQCFSTNSFDFNALGASTNNAVYSWDFGTPNLPNSNLQNPQNIHFPEAGTFTVTLTIQENGCSESYIDEVWVPQDPTLLPSIIPDAGCPPVFGGFIANATSDTQLFYIWNFGDGTSSTEPIVTHFYQNPGIYDVSLQVYTTTGCLDTLTQFLADAITVYPIPNAAFTISPQVVNIFEPTTSILDQSTGAIECQYTMSDGGSSTECSFDYNWTEAGIQTITQTVTNEYGCINQVTGTVFVEGFIFYAPNSFTPNQDGVNDVWLTEN